MQIKNPPGGAKAGFKRFSCFGVAPVPASCDQIGTKKSIARCADRANPSAHHQQLRIDWWWYLIDVIPIFSSSTHMAQAGKVVLGKLYIHTSAIAELNDDIRALAKKAIEIARIETDRFNIIKIDKVADKVSLLNYPHFFEEAFPALAEYWVVSIQDGQVRYRTYSTSLNPPILHRKELLLPVDHPEQQKFTKLTQNAEQIGLFDDTHRIGLKHAWDFLLQQKGYKVVGHDLIPVGNDESEIVESETPFEKVERHRTALTRYDFSAPLQTLARFGFLDGSKLVFDYGCGRGDDLRNLQANNINSAGWDPHFALDGVKQNSDIVNLGFVINVIEDWEERADALRGAYELANQLLVVSAVTSPGSATRIALINPGFQHGPSSPPLLPSQEKGVQSGCAGCERLPE